MTIGTGIASAGGAVLLYRSPDLRQWEYVGPLITCADDRHGVMWECPAFFPLGDKWVLLISVWPRLGTHYFVGTFDGQRFTPEYDAPLDHGAHFFAPQTLLDDAGRRLMIGWIWEGRSDAAQEAAGWSGLQSIPRVLSLRSDHSLGFAPLPAFESLRGEAVTVADIALAPDTPYPLPVHGDCLEIRAEIAPASAGAVSLSLRRSPDGTEQTAIAYDRTAGTLRVDPSRASQSPDVLPVVCSAPLMLDAGEPLRLRVFVDRSVIEVYANERLCLTSRIYPTRPDSLGLQLEALGGTASLIACTVWELRSIWP
jgi:beta-fructofuranosidase